MQYSKTIFFAFPLMVIGSSKTHAFKTTTDLFFPMDDSPSSSFSTITEMQTFLLTSDSILFVGFLLWIAYIIFFFPKDTLKQL